MGQGEETDRDQINGEEERKGRMRRRGRETAAKEKVRPVREREAEQANRTSLILRFTGPSTGYGPV